MLTNKKNCHASINARALPQTLTCSSTRCLESTPDRPRLCHRSCIPGSKRACPPKHCSTGPAVPASRPATQQRPAKSRRRGPLPVPNAFAMLRHGEQTGASRASPAGYLFRFTLPALPAISCGATLALGGTEDTAQSHSSRTRRARMRLFCFFCPVTNFGMADTASAEVGQGAGRVCV